MAKQAVALVLALLVVMVTLHMDLADANPISVPSVPGVQISYPLSSLGGYVNSTVEFEIYVNMFIDSPAPSNISYSLDGEPSVDLEDFEATTYYDYGPDKIDFKTYEASVILKDLSEGNHTLVAYANGMSAHRDFTVNSHYEIAVLKVLSPAGQAYTETVPLIFSVNGEILNAHYYLYRGNELVLDRSLSGNTTLGNLSLGSYDMYLFVTTEDGQTSARIPFSMVDYTHLGENLPIVAGVTGLSLVSVAAGLLVSSRRAERGQESLTAA